MEQLKMMDYVRQKKDTLFSSLFPGNNDTRIAKVKVTNSSDLKRGRPPPDLKEIKSRLPSHIVPSSKAVQKPVVGHSGPKSRATPPRPPFEFSIMWVYVLVVLCAASVCFYIVYQLFSMKVLYSVLGLVSLYLLMSFSVKIYSIYASTHVQISKEEYEYLKSLDRSRTVIEQANCRVTSKSIEEDGKLERAKLEHEREMARIKSGEETEELRIKSQ